MFSQVELLSATAGKWRGAACSVSAVFTDTRKPEKGGLFIALAGEHFDAHTMLDSAVEAGASVLCINEDKIHLAPAEIPLLIVPDTLKAYQQIAAFHRNRFTNLTVFAVTGSVGKTSVKEMLRAICIAACKGNEDEALWTIGNTNNQVGVPQNLLRLNESHRFAVLEAGTNHFGEIRPLSQIIRPDAALVNSIAPCHLEYLRDLDGVATEKREIFSGLNKNGIAVIPADLPQSPILCEGAGKRKILTFGIETGDIQSRYTGGKLGGSSFELRFPDGKKFEISWGLSGAHQACNASAAAAAAYSMGIAPEVIAEGLKNTTLPGSRNRIFQVSGVTYIDDSYNANPKAMEAALNNVAEFADPDKIVLLLGGMRELGTGSVKAHQELLSFIKEKFPGARLLTVGQEYGKGALADWQAAREKLAAIVKPGDVVLAKGSNSYQLSKALPEPEK